MLSVRLRSLAKINLDLRVLHKRSDGFHELRTIFQTVSLADTLHIDFVRSRTSRIAIRSNPEIPDNLILSAADAVLSALGVRARVAFDLVKRIPMGGGLGGGSSNAAAVLLALPALAGIPLPLAQLLEIACSLGSDVPFFLLGGAAVGLGRGTELYPLPDRPSLPGILVCPDLHLSTPDAYRRLARKLTDGPYSPTMNRFQSAAWQIGERGEGGGHSVNDFETIVFRDHPHLESIKETLQSLGACPALMSGSGSTIFGVFDSRLRRDRALARLRREALHNDPGRTKIYPVVLVNRRQYRSLWRRQLPLEVQGKGWPPHARFAK